MHNIGEKVREIRKSKRMTLKEVSEISGVSISYLSDIENGRKNPSLETLNNILEGWHMSLMVFFDDNKDFSQYRFSNDNTEETIKEIIIKSQIYAEEKMHMEERTFYYRLIFMLLRDSGITLGDVFGALLNTLDLQSESQIFEIIRDKELTQEKKSLTLRHDFDGNN